MDKKIAKYEREIENLKYQVEYYKVARGDIVEFIEYALGIQENVRIMKNDIY